MSNLQFSKEEIAFLNDAEPMIQKRLLQERIYELLETTREHIRNALPAEIISKFDIDKISRGENYLSLPYLILDYPARFNDNNILACRTMFLWGNFLSATIHLQGDLLGDNREQLNAIINKLDYANLYVSSGESPWQYHYAPDNYLPPSDDNLADSLKKEFFKLSLRFPLSAYNSLPQTSAEFYSRVLKELKIGF